MKRTIRRKASQNNPAAQETAAPSAKHDAGLQEDAFFSSIGTRIDNKKGQGKALPEDVQQEMERSIGGDLSQVKVHTGDEAEELNTLLSAEAFTAGNDIFFSNGNYNPYSSEGKHLLAHELAHVAQNNKATNGKQVQRKGVSEQAEAQWAFNNPGQVTAVGTASSDKIPDNEFMLWNYLVGAADLRTAHRALLQADVIPRWKKQMEDRPELMVNIIGSASSSGKQAGNDTLAIQRAQSLKDLLVSSGLPAARIINSGVGTTQPLAPEDSPENMARNRRVEMFLFTPTKKVATLGSDVKYNVESFESTFDSNTASNILDKKTNMAHIRSNGIRSSAKVQLSGLPGAQLGFIQFLTGDSRIATYSAGKNPDFNLDYNNCTGPFLPCKDVNETTNKFSYDTKDRVAEADGKTADIAFSDKPGVVFPASTMGGEIKSFTWKMDFVLILGIRSGASFLPLKFQSWVLEYSAAADTDKMKILSSNVSKVNEGDGDPGTVNIDTAMQLRTCRFIMRRMETSSQSNGCRPVRT